jgi:TatA/E family protein of Tat protein translocase
VFGISGFELLIVVVFVLIIFGPDKLPEMAKTIGRAMRMFKKAQDDMERVIRMEMLTGDRDKTTPASVLAPDGPESASTQEANADAVSAAASVWAATSEDDEEEEDEE